MYIKKLDLINFRNYEDLSIDFDEKVNLIVGENAQGKTNLIEAVYLSSMGRSFRTSRDNEMIRFGEKTAVVRVQAEKEYINTKVDITIDRHSKKFFRKDGSPVRKMSELMKNIIIVVFSPEDLSIVKEEPELRRKFIDRELSQIKPVYFNDLSSYRKALLQRNAYLKEDNIDKDMLAVWDNELVKYGAEIMRLRKSFVEKISESAGRIYSSITNGAESMRIEYDPYLEYSDDKAAQREIIASALEKTLETDLKMRTTTAGPHKDDIKFFVNDINARKYGSQGQQRTCALALKLADLDFIKEETGEEGILILDDVMSELDPTRREYLIRALSENQVFITSTEIDEGLLKAYPDAKIITVKKGTVVL